jgi:hypothetical protein
VLEEMRRGKIKQLWALNLLCSDPSNTPHPTSLREATFSHRGPVA